MRQFQSYGTRTLRWVAGAVLLLSGGCSESSPSEPAPQRPQQPEQPQQPPPSQPNPDVGIRGVSDPYSIVCARDAAGTTWCSVASATGAFQIVESTTTPGTGIGSLPAQGQFQVYNVACPSRGLQVDRSGAQRNGGDWLDVRCVGCVAPPAGLLAWYRFDEPAGDTVADYPNAAAPSPLRLHGTTTRIPGKWFGGLDFPLEQGYAQGSAARNLGTGDFSIALWLRLDADDVPGFSTLLDKRHEDAGMHGYHIAFFGTEPLIQLADGGDNGGWYNYHANFSMAADGEWHFLVVTVDRDSPSGVRWYYDGVPVGNVGDPTGRQGSLDSTAPLLVGRHAFFGSGFSGALDELQIVNRVLPPEEITARYQQPSCR